MLCGTAARLAVLWRCAPAPAPLQSCSPGALLSSSPAVPRSCGPARLQSCGPLVLWSCSAAVLRSTCLRSCAPATLQSCKPAVLQVCGPAVQHSPTVLWFSGHAVLRSYGSLVTKNAAAVSMPWGPSLREGECLRSSWNGKTSHHCRESYQFKGFHCKIKGAQLLTESEFSRSSRSEKLGHPKTVARPFFEAKARPRRTMTTPRRTQDGLKTLPRRPNTPRRLQDAPDSLQTSIWEPFGWIVGRVLEGF